MGHFKFHCGIGAMARPGSQTLPHFCPKPMLKNAWQHAHLDAFDVSVSFCDSLSDASCVTTDSFNNFFEGKF